MIRLLHFLGVGVLEKAIGAQGAVEQLPLNLFLGGVGGPSIPTKDNIYYNSNRIIIIVIIVVVIIITIIIIIIITTTTTTTTIIAIIITIILIITIITITYL